MILSFPIFCLVFSPSLILPIVLVLFSFCSFWSLVKMLRKEKYFNFWVFSEIFLFFPHFYCSFVATTLFFFSPIFLFPLTFVFFIFFSCSILEFSWEFLNKFSLDFSSVKKSVKCFSCCCWSFAETNSIPVGRISWSNSIEKSL